MAGIVQLEREERVAVLTIKRPEKLNAISHQMHQAACEMLAELEGDDRVGVVVVTGAGERAFGAGADIGELVGRSPMDERKVLSSPRIWHVFPSFPKPVIAMINGLCVGGACELVMSCDLRIASRNAKLGMPEIKVGLTPGGGGSQRLPRLAGLGQAMKMILTGEMIDAEDAKRIGLVDDVVPPEELRTQTLELAGKIAAKSPETLRIAKQALRAAERMPLQEGILYERALSWRSVSRANKKFDKKSSAEAGKAAENSPPVKRPRRRDVAVSADGPGCRVEIHRGELLLDENPP